MHPWAIVDPALATDLELRDVADRLMRMVRSSWTDVPEVPVLDPKVWAFLSRHRVATIVPPDAVPASMRAGFVERLRNIQASQLRIEATAREVCGVLEDAGIEVRLLKGLASAHLDYPRPELRHTGDVDILLNERDLDAALERLSTVATARDIGRIPQLLKGRTLDGARSVEIDVHTRPVRRAAWGRDWDGLPTEVTPLGPRALAFDLRMAHACAHFFVAPPGGRRLSGLFDVVVRQRSISVEAVLAASDTMRSRPVVDFVLWLIEDLAVGGTSVVETRSLSRVEQAAYLSSSDRSVALHLLKLRDVPARELPRYVPLWLTPTTVFRPPRRRSTR